MYKVVAVVIGLIAVLIVGGILVFSAFDGGEKREAKEVKKLEEIATTDAQVRMTINGPIVAEKDRRSVVITVGRFDVTAQIIEGYEHTVIKSKKENNNESAYTNFLAGLENQGFNKDRAYTGRENELGACPLGQRIVFDTFDGENNIQHTWTTSCSKKIGNFGGNISNVRRLFQNQVSDYNDFVSGVSL